MSAPPPPVAAASASTSAPVAGPSNLRQQAQPETPTHAQTKPFSSIPSHVRPPFPAGPLMSTPVVQRQAGPSTSNQPQPQLRTPIQTPAQKIQEASRAQQPRQNQPLFRPPAPTTAASAAVAGPPPPRPPPQAEREDVIQEDEEPSCTSYFGSEDDNFLAEMDLGIGGPIDFDEGLGGVETESVSSAGSAASAAEERREKEKQPEKEKDKGRSIARSIRAAVAEALGEVDPGRDAGERSGGSDAGGQAQMRQPFGPPQGRLVPIIDASTSTGSFSYPKLQGLNAGTKRGAESMGESSSVLGRRSGQAPPLGMMGLTAQTGRGGGGPRYPLGELRVDAAGDVKRARR